MMPLASLSHGIRLTLKPYTLNHDIDHDAACIILTGHEVDPETINLKP
jgi:hypothetical protein